VGVEPIWEPSPERVERANITRYLHWLRDRRGRRFASYDELWRWSVEDLDGIWTSIWEFFEVGGSAPSPALAERRMPGARWFPGATLNHAELSLRRHDDHPALLFGNEAGELGTISYAELGRRVAAVAAGLRRLGVAKGDRVVVYLPNVPETVVALLATASIGAIWSSCAPEFGVSSVVDRFAQIEPKVLVAVDGYRYGGAWHDRRDALAEIRRRLPTLRATVLVRRLRPGGPPGRGDHAPASGTAPWPGTGCWRRGPGPRWHSSRWPSTIRCGCCTPRAPPGCQRRSSTATAGSPSSC
jgi:acetoacetyl-CoA synthetase